MTSENTLLLSCGLDIAELRGMNKVESMCAVESTVVGGFSFSNNMNSAWQNREQSRTNRACVHR